MTELEALRYIKAQGIVLESARHPSRPNLADIVLGPGRHGSWWAHPSGKDFFCLTRRVRSHADVLVCRLLDRKITYVHRRLWPALARVAPLLGQTRVAAIRERHTKTGAHRVDYTPLHRWLPANLRRRAHMLNINDARRILAGLAIDVKSPSYRRVSSRGVVAAGAAKQFG